MISKFYDKDYHDQLSCSGLGDHSFSLCFKLAIMCSMHDKLYGDGRFKYQREFYYDYLISRLQTNLNICCMVVG